MLISMLHDPLCFVELLGDILQWGLGIKYCVQPSPDRLAPAFSLTKNFFGDNPNALVLGGNIFYVQYLSKIYIEPNTSGQAVFLSHKKMIG